MGVTRGYVVGHSPPSLLNMKTCDYKPLLLSNRLPEMYLNNPKSDTLRFGRVTSVDHDEWIPKSASMTFVFARVRLLGFSVEGFSLCFSWSHYFFVSFAGSKSAH